MDNQHRKISGYRELDQAEIELMNAIKEKGAELGSLVEKLESTQLIIDGKPTGEMVYDQDWVKIGKIHLQQGCMALIRSVTKPGGF